MLPKPCNFVPLHYPFILATVHLRGYAMHKEGYARRDPLSAHEPSTVTARRGPWPRETQVPVKDKPKRVLKTEPVYWLSHRGIEIGGGTTKARPNGFAHA